MAEYTPLSQRISCTVEQGCELTGLGRTSIYALMKSGRLETVAIGKRRLLLMRSLTALIDPKSAATASAAEQPLGAA